MKKFIEKYIKENVNEENLRGYDYNLLNSAEITEAEDSITLDWENLIGMNEKELFGRNKDKKYIINWYDGTQTIITREDFADFMALIDPSIASSKQKRLDDENIHYQKVDAFPGMDYRSSRIMLAEKMTQSGEYFWINQYHNKAGVQAHECTTAPEIYEQTKHRVTHIVCAMGSCGTICGLGRFFHKHKTDVKIIGTEPFGSTIYGKVDCNYINVGAGLVGKPGNLIENPDTVDEAFAVHDEDSVRSAQMLWNLHHFNAGVTTGMSYYIAQRIASRISEGCIVVISPDGRESYSEYLR